MSNKYLTDLENTIALLKKQTELNIQSNWNCCLENTEVKSDRPYVNSITLKESEQVSLNDKGYIIIPQGREVRWLWQKITIPYSLEEYPLSELSLRLSLTWWAEDAKIFINGELVQQGDLFDSSARVLITNKAIPEEEFLIAICLVSPNHDIGALMKSICIYEAVGTEKEEIVIDPGFVADELTILSRYISQFEPYKLKDIATEVSTINWDYIKDSKRFDRSLEEMRSRLIPLSKEIKQRRLNLLGHAHLDMAWLWTTSETYKVARSTFNSVLNLQQDYPYLTFAHTSPALYEWIEENCPDIFQGIQKAIDRNKWEVIGGMWIEPEINLLSGESLIRQLLLGQEYIKEKFGKITTIAWLSDTFGFTWQLPQILKECGIDYFVTGKLHWNDTTKFPYGCFYWESPDGSKIFTLMSPPNVTGVMDTNPLTTIDYALNWESQTGLQDIFWLPGVGDHGGGPTRDMLEVANKWQQSPFYPQIEFTTSLEYLDKISLQEDSSFPIWKDELYLELHRGCYTNHSDQKFFNRHCEHLLYEAELFLTVAIILTGDNLDYAHFPTVTNSTGKTNKKQAPLNKELPLTENLITAWKKVLFNQFHDILPGTSIPEVFAEANKDWESAIDIANNILETAFKAIASKIKLPTPPEAIAIPILIFNSLNWQRSNIVKINLDRSEYKVYDYGNNLIESQITEDNKLVFLAKDIPSVGYKIYWLVEQEKEDIKLEDRERFILENEYLKIIVNPDTGNLESIYDKQSDREILSGSGNELQAFEDKGQYWDAWNINPEYEKYPLSPTKLQSIECLDKGTLQQKIRVIKTLNKSQFIQDYILEKNSPILKISNTVDWQETHVLVKAAFPLTIESNYITSEIACGAIERPTNPTTKAEKAKWEIPALKWIDLTDEKENYGVSLLNDCKYGYDIKPNQIRITLLRSSVWPDPQADIGKHQFTYAIYPHKNSWQKASTVRKSNELNLPLRVHFISTIDRAKNKELGNTKLPPIMKFIDLSADNLILMALKFSKDNSLVLRCYECHGEIANISLSSELNLKIGDELNCLENTVDTNNKAEICKVNPWKIKTYSIESIDS